MRGLGILSATALGVGIALAAAVSGLAQERPGGHFPNPDPITIPADRAEAVYSRIRDDMTRGYRLSGIRTAGIYQRWRRFNRAPYPSAAHGERLVNNYGNVPARSYGLFERGGAMPVGAILAKDSFVVTASGEAFAGPLFLMEKMPAGFAPEYGDWRYTSIMPDGSVLGISGGEGSTKVAFCGECHKAVAGDQHLFFLPRQYRASAP